MSDLLSMGIGVVVGGAVSSSYYKSAGRAEAVAKRLGERWEKTNKRASAVGDLVRYRAALDALRRKQGEVGASNTRVARGIADLERRYREAKRQVKAYGIDVGGAARAHRRLQRELRGTELMQRGHRWRTAGAAGLGRTRHVALGAAGAAYGVGRVLRSGMERETQEIYLKSVIVPKDGNVDAAMGRFTEHVRRTAKSLMAKEEDLLEIGYQLSSAGLDDELARVGSLISHKLARVTRGDDKEAASVLGGVMLNMSKGLGGTAEENLSRIGDVLAQTQLMYKFDDFGQLAASFAEGASGAMGYRVSLEQTTAALGLLNSTQLEGGRAGTAFNATVRNMERAAAQFDTVVARNAAGGIDLLGSMENLQAATDGMDAKALEAGLLKAFGEEGLQGAIRLLRNLDVLRKGVEDTAKATGVVDKEYSNLLASTAGQWELLTSNVGQVGNAFARTLLPAVRWVVGVLGRVVEIVGVAINVWPGLGKTVAFAAAGFVGLTAIIGIANALTWIFGGTVGVIGTVLRGASKAAWLWAAASKIATAATWLWNVALAANPLVWVGAAVVAVAGLIWYFWEPLANFFKRLWSHETIKTWLGWVGAAVDSVKGFLRWVGLIDDEAAITVGATEDTAVGATQTTRRGQSRRDRRNRDRAAAGERSRQVGDAAKRTAAAAGVAVGAALPAAAQPPDLPAPLPTLPAAAQPPDLPAPLPTLEALQQDVVPSPAFHAPTPAPTPTSSVRVNAQITVNPPAGADATAIALEVQRQIREVQRRAEVEAGLGESDA